MKKMRRTKNILLYPAIFDPIMDKGFEGGFNVYFPDFPGCATFGTSFEDAEKMAEEALSLWIETLVENGEKLPKRNNLPMVHNISTAVPANI